MTAVPNFMLLISQTTFLIFIHLTVSRPDPLQQSLVPGAFSQWCTTGLRVVFSRY